MRTNTIVTGVTCLEDLLEAAKYLGVTMWASDEPLYTNKRNIYPTNVGTHTRKNSLYYNFHAPYGDHKVVSINEIKRCSFKEKHNSNLLQKLS